MNYDDHYRTYFNDHFPRYEHSHPDENHGHHAVITLLDELETPHSFDPIAAKDINDPSIFFHSYEDFPPDFYKAEYYTDAYK